MAANLAWARRNQIPEEKVRGLDDPDRGPFTPREKAVLKLAEIMAHRSEAVLEAAVLEELKRELTDEELVELGMYFALVTGFQKFNTAFGILYACATEPPTGGPHAVSRSLGGSPSGGADLTEEREMR